ncbi:molybdopterin molybdotransferase MoeA [Subtercola boreus]|uniref:Molybdopterin molybdenumtransferase n=1 Tax=Subtercola boreus TaxID=120213 RepID=A0A3E0W9M0_9MICO|nr:molybdopterin molybdotransferase MoeA [Subtercola boreus]RFA19080.1 hypothetical protein B7R24_13195 [Subtercola boreus]RFA19218.1 hypothetical protein B7R23_13175 [Subtercola boreus]RFA25680.1 hypothetical protein B7R25_13295 [Subtercola boreus]
MTDRLVRPDWSAARQRAWEAAEPLVSVDVPLLHAAGRTLARDVVALSDVPHYASSAMDGWAVAGDGPWMLVPAASAAQPLTAGQAQVIVTGGLVPPGATRVVRSEQGSVHTAPTPEPSAGSATGATKDGVRLLLTETPDAVGDQARRRGHIRPSGEEARLGATVLRAHTVLNPAHVAVAAASGHDTLPVVARARVALVLTGDEVQLAGIPLPGFVRDSFGVTLPTLVASLGGDVIATLRVPDTLAAFVAALGAIPAALPSAATSADLIITTGSTGTSQVDHLHAALEALGAELLVDRVAMRPGGPSLLARLPDGRLLLGLPGNPLAAMVGLLSFGPPLLAAFAGLTAPLETSVITRDVLSGRPGAVLLSPYRLVDGRAVLNDWSGSAMMRGLAEADGILICPEAGAAAGERVSALPVPWL